MTAPLRSIYTDSRPPLDTTSQTQADISDDHPHQTCKSPCETAHKKQNDFLKHFSDLILFSPRLAAENNNNDAPPHGRFLGSPLLWLMWHEWPSESSFARDILLSDALRMEAFHQSILSVSYRYAPVLFFQALVKASSPTESRQQYDRSGEQGNSLQVWKDIERSSRFIQLTLPGFPIEKSLLAQLIVRDLQQREGGDLVNTIPTLMIVIQALLDSYRETMPDGTDLTSLIMQGIETRVANSSRMSPIIGRSHGDDPRDVKVLDSDEDDDSDKMENENDSTAGGTPRSSWDNATTPDCGNVAADIDANPFVPWVTQIVELLKALGDRKDQSEVVRLVEHLIYEKLMIMEAETFSWVSGVVPSFVEETLSQRGLLKRPLGSLMFLEDLTLLKEMTEIVAETRTSVELERQLRQKLMLVIRRVSPFNRRFWDYTKAHPFFGTPEYQDLLASRLSKCDRIKCFLNLESCRFDAHFAWLLRTVLASLSATMTDSAHS